MTRNVIAGGGIAGLEALIALRGHPTDEHGAVPGAEGVWAAGDGTAFGA